MVAATNVIEEMHSLPFYDLFATFNRIPADDPHESLELGVGDALAVDLGDLLIGGGAPRSNSPEDEHQHDHAE